MNQVAFTRVSAVALAAISLLAMLCSAFLPNSAPGTAALLSLGSILLASGPLAQSP
ncbi:MAG: hypothetical protein KF699_11780 [Phycisphaeraceae bacterium]|nr:hypothetical protein [Phycisphaeraceae bacterium]MBX3407225.1 hypothetical protein [Phycisphaeraceae bacterium]